MIHNQQQYEQTKQWAERFRCSIQEAQRTPLEGPGIDPRMKDIVVSGMRAQLQDLLDEMREYEERNAGKYRLAA